MSSFHSSNKATPSTTTEADSTAVIRITLGPDGHSWETEEGKAPYHEHRLTFGGMNRLVKSHRGKWGMDWFSCNNFLVIYCSRGFPTHSVCLTRPNMRIQYFVQGCFDFSVVQTTNLASNDQPSDQWKLCCLLPKQIFPFIFLKGTITG